MKFNVKSMDNGLVYISMGNFKDDTDCANVVFEAHDKEMMLLALEPALTTLYNHYSDRLYKEFTHG